jgi:molybdopterin-binding protein
VGVNLLAGTARPGGVVSVGGLELHAASSLVDEGDVEGDVFAVVHPRAVALHRARPEGSARNVWAGEATSVEVADGRARVQVAIEGAPLPLVAEVTPAAVAELRLVDGGRVWASVKATEVTVYAR